MPKVEKKDPYTVLDISRSSAEDDIRAAYKKMALEWHPDRHLSGKEKAAQKFIEGHDAYRTLMHEQRKLRRARRAEKKAERAEKAEKANTQSDSHSSASNADAGPSSQRSNSGSQASHNTHATHASPASSRGDKDFSPEGSPRHSDFNPDSRPPSASGSKTPPSEPRSDHVSTHSKTNGEHVLPPSSPQRTERTRQSPSPSSHASDKTHSDTPPNPQPETSPQPHPSSPQTSPSRSKLHKKRKATSGAPDGSESGHTTSSSIDDDEPLLRDYVHITKSEDVPSEQNGHGISDIPVDEDGNLEPALRPIETPRSSSKEWVFPLELSLEELFNGTSLRFRITRRLLSHERKQSLVAIDIPEGTLTGTKIRCPGVGHQRKDTTFQDVVFIVEERPHDRFHRVKDDLFLDVFVPYVDQLAENGGDICVEGIDEVDITVNIPYPIDQKSTEGKVIVKGAGMPFRKGRGDLIVRWQVVFPATSKWDLLKKVLHLHH